jgi:hypothetical protein
MERGDRAPLLPEVTVLSSPHSPSAGERLSRKNDQAHNQGRFGVNAFLG